MAPEQAAGRTDAVLDELRAALEESPERIDLLRLRAGVHLVRGERDTAEAQLRELIDGSAGPGPSIELGA